MSGPHEQRLRAMLHGANRQMIQAAYQEWRAGSELLLAVSTTLHGAAPRIQDQFGRTGPAAARAFGKVAGKVAARSEQMSAAGQALVAALDVIAQAESLRDSFDATPLSEPTRPTASPGPSTPEDVAARKQYDSHKASYDAAYADRETRAAATAERMDTVFAESTETMKQIHGDPDPAPQPTQDSGGTGSTGSTPSSGGTAPRGGYVTTSGGHQSHTTTTTAHTSEPSPSGTTTTTTHHPAPTGGPTGTPSGTPSSTPGTAQGGNDAYPTGTPTGSAVPLGGIPSGSSTSTGLTAPTAGGLAGAVGGGALGGLTGISGAVRGSSLVPTGSAAGAAGGRTIGSTTRTVATSGTLGRGTATGGAAGTSRGGAAGATGSRSGSARGGAGSRGAAGGRGTPGGQGGRNKKDPRKKNTDFFEEEQDWVDDEGAAPGVID